VTVLFGKRIWQEAIRILRFGIVGLGGFVVDAAVLAIMVHGLGANPYAGRAVSVPIAILFTFVCNRYWSFASLEQPTPAAAFASYVSTQGAGLLCNLAVYSVMLLALPSPLGALAIASAVAMFVNYLGARFWAFRG
jgi:putative flippase GtrA